MMQPLAKKKLLSVNLPKLGPRACGSSQNAWAITFNVKLLQSFTSAQPAASCPFVGDGPETFINIVQYLGSDTMGALSRALITGDYGL